MVITGKRLKNKLKGGRKGEIIKSTHIVNVKNLKEPQFWSSSYRPCHPRAWLKGKKIVSLKRMTPAHPIP